MSDLIEQPTPSPTRKMAATGIGGVVTLAILAALDAWVPGLGDILSGEVTAIVTLVGAWVSGYMAKERKV
jgi:hypothetical protein